MPEIIFFLLCLSFPVVILGVWAFFWALKKGQLEDLEAEGQRILFKDDDFPLLDKQDESLESKEKK